MLIYLYMTYNIVPHITTTHIAFCFHSIILCTYPCIDCNTVNLLCPAKKKKKKKAFLGNDQLSQDARSMSSLFGGKIWAVTLYASPQIDHQSTRLEPAFQSEGLRESALLGYHKVYRPNPHYCQMN